MGGTKRALRRPAHLDLPYDLRKSDPVPQPQQVAMPDEPDAERKNPVRYGDWEHKGIAIDF
ncbi:hypothetical protein LPB140_00690 [Sphingorhabdus lutea]|uniref:DUF1674 domain-containing protein n=1 Tax=Sphingorhabdus lutea TaxID=1913578 RepID=A0A1L3JE53_9SPHN|nr:DUF1674 domain-containing protein [Sphingorhabdus lutea]APG63428.1 hypothetical protein LPB140_00690 [Sphingorhabdus lutea]